MGKIDEVLARLNPKTAEAFVRASELETDYLSTPSLGLNMAIGGLRYGAIHTLWGSRSSGKSMFCLGLVREAQANGKTVAWVDAEKNFDKDWARRHNVDVEDLIISHTTKMADTADQSVDLVRSGIDLLVIDSMSVLLPQSYFDDGEMKNLEKTNQIGTFAKNFASMMNMLNNVNQHTCIVVISQVRNKFHQYGASKALMGGEAAEFMNSTIIKFWAPLSEKETIMGKVHSGDSILERPVGRPVNWTVDKARGAGMNQTGKYDMYFAGEDVGIDLSGEILDFGIERGVIKKGGAWITIGEEKFQGRPNAITHLRDNPDIQEKLYLEIMEKAGR